MVRPPPGVSSGSSVPCIASVRPRDTVSPSPTPKTGFYDVRPRIRLMPSADSSDFAKNPAAGLSAMSSV